MWTQNKADRMSWISKIYNEDVDSMSIQDHMEMDSLMGELDMPSRWGLCRMIEFDGLNILALSLVTYTDFHGIKPTDLGLRPDGTVRTCAVQFHTVRR